jgi:hypothetical protein
MVINYVDGSGGYATLDGRRAIYFDIIEADDGFRVRVSEDELEENESVEDIEEQIEGHKLVREQLADNEDEEVYAKSLGEWGYHGVSQRDFI